MDSCGIITESGLQFLNRLERRKALSGLEISLFPEEFEAGSAVEITGEAGIGKSELLLHFVLKCIMPVSWHNHHLGGFHVGVIFFDNDHHLYLPRLVDLLDKKLRAKVLLKNIVPSDEEVQEFVTACLELLRIVRCHDSAQFILTLQYINSFVSSKYDSSILVVDSISSFYYEDRMMKSDNLNHLDAYYKQLASILKKFLDDDKFVIFFTRQDLIKPPTKTVKWQDNSFNQEFYFMGRDIQKIVSWRISLYKETASSNIITAEIIHRTKVWKRSFSISDGGIQFDI